MIVPSLSDILLLSKGPYPAFEFFMNRLLCRAIGSSNWNENAHKMTVSNLTSPCDEAYVLLLLETHMLRWRRETGLPEEDGSVASIMSEDSESADSQWSQKVIKRFNDLQDMVLLDREEEGRKTYEAIIKQEHCIKQASLNGKCTQKGRKVAAIPHALKTNFGFLCDKKAIEDTYEDL